MRKSSFIDDMNSSLMRAKEQHIFVPLQEFKEQTQTLFMKDLEGIRANYEKNREKVACQTLGKLVKLNKNLYYLRQLTPEYE